MPVSERTNSAVPRSVTGTLCFRTLITQVIASSLQKALFWILPQSARLQSTFRQQLSTELHEGQRAEKWRGRCFTPCCLHAVWMRYGDGTCYTRLGALLIYVPASESTQIVQQSQLIQQRWLKSSFVPPSLMCWAEESPTPGFSYVSLKAFLSQLANKICQWIIIFFQYLTVQGIALSPASNLIRMHSLANP